MKKLSFLFYCLFIILFFACSDKDDDEDIFKDSFLETNELILGSGVNDTIVKFQTKYMYNIREVRTIIGKDTIWYEFDDYLGVLQDDWFGIVLSKGKLNVRTNSNQSNKERHLDIFWMYAGRLDYLNITQKAAW